MLLQSSLTIRFCLAKKKIEREAVRPLFAPVAGMIAGPKREFNEMEVTKLFVS